MVIRVLESACSSIYEIIHIWTLRYRFASLKAFKFCSGCTCSIQVFCLLDACLAYGSLLGLVGSWCNDCLCVSLLKEAERFQEAQLWTANALNTFCCFSKMLEKGNVAFEV